MALNLPTLAELERERAVRPLSKVTQAGRLEAATRKHDRRQGRQKEKQEGDRVAREVFAARREQAYRRDLGRCRAFGVALKLVSDDPLKLAAWWETAQPHHKNYRSRGGTDDVSNLITLSPKAHKWIHDGRIRVFGEPDGVLSFVLIELETGRVLQEWESVAGKRVVGAPKVTA